ERMSFGTPGLTLELDQLAGVVHGPGEKRHFFSLLMNIGSDPVLKLEPSDRLPKHQRQLLAQAQESLSSWQSVPPLGIAWGSRLTDTPRFNVGGRSLVVGPYHSAESRDLQLAETYGSGDPLLDTTDEIRFSPRTSELVSLNIGVPERPTRDSAFIECVEALPLRR